MLFSIMFHMIRTDCLKNYHVLSAHASSLTCSSGNGKKLIIEMLLVRVPAAVTRWIFFSLICCKIVFEWLFTF